MTAITSTTATTATNAASTAAAATTPTPADQQDRFLKLLVAQLNNQDPMNPMDNAQMTSQMAQINTVTGIQQLNETVKSLTQQFTALQSMQGANMVGHDVLVAGNRLQIANAQGQGSFDLGANADNVKVEVTTAGGQVVGNISLGSMGVGRHNFTWDAGNYTNTDGLKFKITATNAGTAVASTALERDKIVAAGSDANGLTLTTETGASVPYSNVVAIY